MFVKTIEYYRSTLSLMTETLAKPYTQIESRRLAASISTITRHPAESAKLPQTTSAASWFELLLMAPKMKTTSKKPGSPHTPRQDCAGRQRGSDR